MRGADLARSLLRGIAIFASACAITACGHIDTGQIDYRVAEPAARMDPQTLEQWHRQTCPATASSCRPLNIGRLTRRNQPGAAQFTAPSLTDTANTGRRQVYSIELEQGMIGQNILEGIILGHQFGASGEIAILANVFELSDTREAAQRFVEPGQYRQASEAAEGGELKLIYYSNDVRRRQALNFSNVPLLTRREYSGRSVAIQIVVIEVDARSGPMTSLLQTLARFGQQAIPAVPGAQEVLADLGEALFSSTSQDDVLFDYRFVLSAPGTDSGAVQATLAPGRYVIRRAQDRVTPMTWQDLVLDHNTGRMYRNANGAYMEVQDDLYLTLNIRQYPPGTSSEHYAFQDWHAFRDAMAEAADPHAASINSVTNNMSQILAIIYLT